MTRFWDRVGRVPADVVLRALFGGFFGVACLAMLLVVAGPDLVRAVAAERVVGTVERCDGGTSDRVRCDVRTESGVVVARTSDLFVPGDGDEVVMVPVAGEVAYELVNLGTYVTPFVLLVLLLAAGGMVREAIELARPEDDAT